MFKNRKGFTLIELLIVVVIIGILAAIAIPKFSNTKEKAVIASMKSDLRNMVTAQEAHFADYGIYAGAIGPVQASGTAAFVPSQGNTIVTAVSVSGWNATATHLPVLSTITNCTIYGNGAPALPPATAEGAPACA